MGYPSYQSILETFVSRGKEAYDGFTKAHNIPDASPADIVFKEVEDEVKSGQLEINNKDQFAKETKRFYGNICKHIKGDDEKFKFSQELDKILSKITQEVEERETLHLASKLQKKIGHRLQKYRSVCGYGLSGVFMKFEIKMLKDSREQEDIVAFLEKVMKLEIEFKDKQVYDLVVFVVIGKLPVLNPDQHLTLEYMEHSGLNGKPNFQTVGALFEIEGENGWYYSTCTHGKEFDLCKFKIHLEGMDPLDANHGYSLYVKPKGPDDDLTPCKTYLDKEKDVHNPGAVGDASTNALDNNETDKVQNTLDKSTKAKKLRASKSVGASAVDNEGPSESSLGGSPSARSVKRSLSEAPVGLQCEKMVKREFSELQKCCVGDTSPSTCPKTSAMTTYQTMPSVDESGYGSSLASSHPSLPSQNSTGSNSSLPLTSQISGSSDVFPNDNVETQPNAPHVVRPKVYRRQSSDGATVSRAIGDISLKDNGTSRHVGSGENTEYKRTPSEHNSPSSRHEGQNLCPRYSGNISSEPHIDLCLLKVDSERVGSLLNMNKPYSRCLKEIWQETSDIDIETVRKYGITTGVTEGRVVEWNAALQGLLEGRIVWMNNMIITEQMHDFEKVVEVVENSPEPVNLIPDAKNSDAARPNQNEGANSEGATAAPTPFAAQGDSGAVITTMPSGEDRNVQAIANHLYHYNSKANLYQRELNYSVSSPLWQSVKELEVRHRKEDKIKMAPMFLPLGLEYTCGQQSNVQ